MLYEKIVAIDDDVRQLESIKLVLGNYYEIICFKNGEEALAYLKRPNGIRLVLLDICMKGMDGLAVLHEIREMGQEIMVIIMTGYGSKEVAVQALRHGANDFIDKPFDVHALKEKVQKFLKKNTGQEGDRELIPGRMKSFMEKNLADVTLKEMAEDLCLSEKYVGRVFKKKSTLSFRDCKINMKVEKAKDLLKGTAHPIYKISSMLGYQNPETFMRMFKRKTGLSPLQYRESPPERP
jgi:YesN/AraC family two-component response regulator